VGLGTEAQPHYPRLRVAGVEVARDVVLAAVVVREQHVIRMVVHAVGEAQVLAHVLPEGHGVTRDLEVVQLATPTVAGVKVAIFGPCVVADRAAIEHHN